MVQDVWQEVFVFMCAVQPPDYHLHPYSAERMWTAGDVTGAKRIRMTSRLAAEVSDKTDTGDRER